MDLHYKSTRNAAEKVCASAAILNGLASEGGLYVPEYIPVFEKPLELMKSFSYQETAFEVLRLFLTDYSDDELKSCIESAYKVRNDSKTGDGRGFDSSDIVNFRKVGETWYLELYHGATLAFKDMALSILPHLLKLAAKKQGVTDEIVILTATSGDTGTAALSGFADVEGIRIVVFYPKDGVSEIQRLQMVTQKGKNVNVVAINGNFDQAQSGVKAIFEDEKLKKELFEAGFRLSSANSINIGRLVPQIVYYVYSYLHLLNTGELKTGDLLNVAVPTGNFGNILAAYYAKKMGIPIGKLICASNENKVLFDFFETGKYNKNRPFVLTSSPSMDILISSNLERLLYYISGEDTDKTSDLMKQLKDKGEYEITSEMKNKLEDFVGGYANQKETEKQIKSVYEKYKYVIDPHTAVASRVLEKMSGEAEEPCLIVSTASPYKFLQSVTGTIVDVPENTPELELPERLANIIGSEKPAAIESIINGEILHLTVCEPQNMEFVLRKILMNQ
ncbi:MAG: threonine synthase [Lachnospiraceae bacterium]|jgi:threonine synthase|nr:threonine synthase [Lachnospiraceae bacterium]